MAIAPHLVDYGDEPAKVLNDLPVSLDHLCVSATPAVQDDRLREAPHAQGPHQDCIGTQAWQRGDGRRGVGRVARLRWVACRGGGQSGTRADGGADCSRLLAVVDSRLLAVDGLFDGRLGLAVRARRRARACGGAHGCRLGAFLIALLIGVGGRSSVFSFALLIISCRSPLFCHGFDVLSRGSFVVSSHGCLCCRCSWGVRLRRLRHPVVSGLLRGPWATRTQRLRGRRARPVEEDVLVEAVLFRRHSQVKIKR
mmetsp:Transcript_20791/g.61939  ORF Transcript_20791/g.61939 Transcript_20791/m.61939 type:complete len:254 (+) Transcript_20791:250-1011(+)